MPIDVNESVRLSDIAKATIRVASERGSRGVTLRSVAEHLGRSTAFITNFVPSRAQLMVNALEHARAGWGADREERLSGTVGIERMVGVARWMCTTSAEDIVLRALWIEAIADVRGANAAYEVVKTVTDTTYAEFLRSSHDAGLAHAEQIADILYLFCRGFHVKSVEDPDIWTDEKANRALEHLLNKLLLDARGS